jgi:hypothetical protein
MNQLVPIASGAFDYTSLRPEVSANIRTIANKIRSLVKAQVDHILDIGGKLATVKATLGHGHFGPWLKAEFGWSERTAQRYIQAAEWAEGKSDTVSYLEPSVLYLLSAPSTSQKIQTEMLDRLETGVPLSTGDIRAACAKDRKSVEPVAVEVRAAKEGQEYPSAMAYAGGANSKGSDKRRKEVVQVIKEWFIEYPEVKAEVVLQLFKKDEGLKRECLLLWQAQSWKERAMALIAEATPEQCHWLKKAEKSAEA